MAQRKYSKTDLPAIAPDEIESLVTAFHDNIWKDNDESKSALQYITEKRKASLETVKKRKIGFCSSAFEDFPESIKGRGYSRFIKGRVIIPVYSEFGEPVSFATRSNLPEMKGWWHIPFSKINNLFLLNDSREHIFHSNKVYITEGFFDSIILYQFGLRNVVSLMGTNLSYRRIGLLARYGEDYCLCFDVDPEDNKAGQTAQIKAIAELSSIGVENISQIKDLPVGMDPDEYVIASGLDNFLYMEKNVTEEEKYEAQKKFRRQVK